ncbi:MAG: hypothetical protein RM021_003960 [Nostoc sp. EkiNYC01]|nr:hypothetical protein [Nostoc sp. EkiNYC01]
MVNKKLVYFQIGIVLAVILLEIDKLGAEIPKGANLLPKSQWTMQPPGGKTDLVSYGAVQGVWGCVKFDILPRGANILCGYLNIGTAPQPTAARAGFEWRCIPGSGISLYQEPFNGPICSFVYVSSPSPKGSFVPTLAEQGQAVQRIATFRNIVLGSPVYRCVQPNNVVVYKPTASSLEISLKTFIPSPAVALYPAPGASIPIGLFGADDRGFDYNGKTFRSFQSIVIEPNNPIGKFKIRGWGQSTGYQVSDGTRLGIPDWWWKLKSGAIPVNKQRLVVSDSNNKISVVPIDTSTTKVTFFLKGNNPANTLPINPDIDAVINVFVRKVPGSSTIQYKIQGGHDGFPAYEIYINGANVYKYDPVAARKSPFDLFGGPDDININTAYKNAVCP